jgi:preprotein translocase subunit SecE
MADKPLLDDPNVEPRIVRFVKDSKVEMDKVDWPSRKDTRNLTILVLALTAVAAAFLGVIDQLLTLLYQGLRAIFGVA